MARRPPGDAAAPSNGTQGDRCLRHDSEPGRPAPSSSSCKTVTCDMVKLQQLRNTSMLSNKLKTNEFHDDWATTFDVRLSKNIMLTDAVDAGASALLSHPHNLTHTFKSCVGTPSWLPLGAYIACGYWDAWVWASSFLKQRIGWHQPFIEKPYGTDVSLRVAHTHTELTHEL